MNIKELVKRSITYGREVIKNKQKLKKARILLYVILLAWVGVGVQMIVNYAYHDESKIINAFSEAEPKVVQSKLTLVGKFGDKYMTTTDKNNMIDYITGKLNIENSLDKEEVDGSTTTAVVAKKEGTNANAEIEVISIDSKEEGSAKKTNQYVYTTIELYEDISRILEYKKIVDDTYDDLGLKEKDASVMLQGTYDKKLLLDEKNAIADEMLEKLQAKIVKENRTEEKGSVYTIYAYTPLIEDYITVNNSRVNVNIVYTYDESDDITTLYVATPILNTDY